MNPTLEKLASVGSLDLLNRLPIGGARAGLAIGFAANGSFFEKKPLAVILQLLGHHFKERIHLNMKERRWQNLLQRLC